MKEQRALEAGKGAVDLSHYSVVTVTGEDRLSWLTTLSSQQLTGLQAAQQSFARIQGLSLFSYLR